MIIFQSHLFKKVSLSQLLPLEAYALARVLVGLLGTNVPVSPSALLTQRDVNNPTDMQVLAKDLLAALPSSDEQSLQATSPLPPRAQLTTKQAQDGVQKVWAVKVRRAAGLPKYTQIVDGSAQGLYKVTALEGYETVLFVDGEFDALLVEQECTGVVRVATVGCAARMLNSHWLLLLLNCKTTLVACDADEVGIKGAERLQTPSQRTRVIQVSWGKDITEFVLQSGSVPKWLNENL
ncbi:MAG: hypothetical protein ABI947_23065 [Chloroflexota bacterium]